MPVSNSLVLDHFYITLPEVKFLKFKFIVDVLSGSHQAVKTNDDFWEGIYFFSRFRDNFEVLKGSPDGGLGIAFSPQNLVAVDVKKIMEEQPNLSWQHGLRSRTDNSPWFGWYSLADYRDDANPCNIWIMDYYKYHLDYKNQLLPKPIDSFDLLELVSGPEMKKMIEDRLQFKDCQVSYSGNDMTFVIQRRDALDFKIVVHFKEGQKNFSPVKLICNLHDKYPHDLSALDGVEWLIKTDNKLIFDFTKL